MQFCIFDFQGHYDDVKMYLMAKWDMKSYLRLILYLNMKKKWAIPIHPNGLFIGMFLPIYAMYYKNRAYGRLSWTDAHSVFNSDKELNMVSNFPGKTWGIFGQKLLRRNYFSFGRDERKRAKMRVLRDFLWNAYNGLKRMQKKFGMIWSILKNLRARKRARQKRTRIFARIFLPEIDPDGYWS